MNKGRDGLKRIYQSKGGRTKMIEGVIAKGEEMQTGWRSTRLRYEAMS